MGLSVLFYATLLLAHGVQPCTIVELDSSGFAENAYSLLHALPMFFQRNGTFFLDNSKFTFKCSNNGGWHDFFSGEENIVPWSRQKETMHGEDCARYTRHEVDQLLHTVLQTKPDLLDFIGIKKAWRYRPWVQDYVDQQLKVMARHASPTIGFHIRGGNLSHPEKSRSRARSSPVDMVQIFTHTYPHIRGGTCVLVGAQQQMAEAAQAAERHLKCKVLQLKPYRKADKGKATGADRKEAQESDRQCSGTVQMLIDMELLAHTDYLVASDRSKWSKILQYMRYILYDKDRSSFVDGSRAHTDLYSAIRRYIDPSAAAVMKINDAAKLDEGVEDALEPPLAQMQGTRKRPRKGPGGKRKAPRKPPPQPPPPPAPDQDMGEDDEYDFEDAA